MFGAIYVGLSGLNAYAKGLQTVSNNVTNMNTVGFKSSTVTFSDSFGTPSRGGLDPARGSESGGHGVTVNARTLNLAQGEARQTDRDLDFAVDGNGFLTLLDGETAVYARTGSFEVAADGHIVLQGTKLRLAVLDAAGRPQAVNIDAHRTDPPLATGRVSFADNLSSTATSYAMPDVTVYDARGTAHRWSVRFTRPEAVFDTWTVKVTDAAGKDIGSHQLRFSGGQVVADTAAPVFENAEAGLSVVFDFSKNVTSFSSGTVSSLRAAAVEGHATGSLTIVRIDDQGALELTYSNNEKTRLGALALADFRDPQALEQRGRGLFGYSGFGQRQYLAADDPRVGTVKGGRLEASNVDLGGQFGDLILIQRGFQASSQIVSVTNDMIQQLFGIRGQG